VKLARYDGGRIGVIEGDQVHDVTAIAGVDPAAWPPVGMVHVIRDFAALKPKFAAALKTPGKPLSSVRLDAPVAWPNKLIAYPVNYVAHGTEMKSAGRADTLGFFLLSPSSLSGPSDPIVLPDAPGREIHHECELGIIIGKRARHIAAKDALDCVFGYCCLIDMTIRGPEERGMRKSHDTFTPIGPYLTTADEVGDPGALDLKLWVNGKVRQDANTRDLIVNVPNMVAVAASVMTLEPGDVIATGTPAGVGPVAPGDTVDIEIARVGRMSLKAVAAR
jgi:2-keto-4-pentenoate hydratase/2-oxohepta-3-ene-1,7-dioic acid hydratase in catechol pathway